MRLERLPERPPLRGAARGGGTAGPPASVHEHGLPSSGSSSEHAAARPHAQPQPQPRPAKTAWFSEALRETASRHDHHTQRHHCVQRSNRPTWFQPTQRLDGRVLRANTPTAPSRCRRRPPRPVRPRPRRRGCRSPPKAVGHAPRCGAGSSRSVVHPVHHAVFGELLGGRQERLQPAPAPLLTTKTSPPRPL